MKDTKIIKIVLPGMCPHCGKEILISTRMLTPLVDWVLKKEDIENAKNKVKEEIENINFKNKEEKKIIIDWLNDENTLFGPDEVKTIIEQILKNNYDEGKKEK